jgi:hypothetical protein
MGGKESSVYPVSLLDVSTGDCPIMIPHSGPRADRGPSLAPWLRPWPRGPTRLWGWLRAVLWATVALVVDPGSRPRPMLPAPGPGRSSRLPAPADAPGSRSRPILPAPDPGRCSRLPVPADPPGPGPGRLCRSCQLHRTARLRYRPVLRLVSGFLAATPLPRPPVVGDFPVVTVGPWG